jgi:hypothetical protein
MNTKQIFRATGALALVVAGAFAGRASAKFGATVPALFYSEGAGVCTPLKSSNLDANFQTITGTGTVQAYIITAAGVTARLLFYTSTCSSASKVYFRG